MRMRKKRMRTPANEKVCAAKLPAVLTERLPPHVASALGGNRHGACLHDRPPPTLTLVADPWWLGIEGFKGLHGLVVLCLLRQQHLVSDGCRGDLACPPPPSLLFQACGCKDWNRTFSVADRCTKRALSSGAMARHASPAMRAMSLTFFTSGCSCVPRRNTAFEQGCLKARIQKAASFSRFAGAALVEQEDFSLESAALHACPLACLQRCEPVARVLHETGRQKRSRRGQTCWHEQP